MKKYKTVDFDRFDARTILTESRLDTDSVSKLSNDVIAKRMGLGEETVGRYQREPHDGERDYGLPIRRVALWNRAVGNDLVVQWLCHDCGGVFVKVDGESPADMNLVSQVNQMNESSSLVVNKLLKALEDDTLSEAERAGLIAPLRVHLRRVEQALLCAEGKSTTGTA